MRILLASLMASLLLFIGGTSEARIRRVDVEIVKGFSISIPLPSTKPESHARDVIDLFQQGRFFWEYHYYFQVDINNDGTPDYYVKVEAIFGPPSHLLTIRVEWLKINLSPEERKILTKKNVAVYNGIEGRDYTSFLWSVAKQHMEYLLDWHKEKASRFNSMFIIKRTPDADYERLYQTDFEDFLRKSAPITPAAH